MKQFYSLRISLLVFLMLLLFESYARDKATSYSIEGRVKDQHGKALELVYVVLNNVVSTVSDNDGQFKFKNIRSGKYQYYVTLLGYEPKSGVLTVDKNITGLNFILDKSDLELDEVVVTARPIETGSKSVIEGEALRHIQPKSLEDVLQLLPGGLTENPSLNNLGQVKIREIEDDDNNSLGAAVIVDGVHLSNDANMQILSLTKNQNRSSSSEDGMNDQTTAGRGVDLRTISADNIESVEVIRGIPSVEYGNLTSGVVIVKTKTGVTPLEIKAKTDPFSKLVSAGKGFSVGDGAVNVGIDWSQSYGDTRKRYLGYERLTASVGYSTTLNKNGLRPVSFNVRTSMHSNINSRRNDPQLDELQRNFWNKNKGFRISLNGFVHMNNWLTSINYNFSGQVSHLEDKHHNWIFSPDGVITNSFEPGLHEAQFKNKSYFSDYTIDGRPINLYGQIKANKYMQIGDNNFSNFKAGADFRYEANKGDGLIFSMDNPPLSQGSQTLRPRSFKSIPALYNLSLFLENDTKLDIGTTSIKSVVGARFNAFLLDEVKSGRSSISVLEPRINLTYNILNHDNNSRFEKLSIYGGYGISNKMPTLLHLYPDKAYFDNVSLNRFGDSESSTMALMTSHIVTETNNRDLKPTTSRKWELGLSFDIKGINGYVTYFNDKIDDEFGYQSQLEWSKYDRYDVPVGSDNISFENGEVSYELNGKRELATSRPLVELETWSKPSNTSQSRKHGIEYAIDMGQLKALRTSLYIDGAWFYIKRKSSVESLYYIDDQYDYVPVMPAGRGTIRERINTNFRFITHIPAVKFVFSTTIQVVWSEKRSTIYEDSNGDPTYKLSKDGSRYRVAPLGFHSRSGEYLEWKGEYAEDDRYKRMTQDYLLYSFYEDKVSPWVLLNFRLTKEFGDVGEVSFMANNFINRSSWHVNEHSTSRRQLYPSMYFGAELKIKL